MPPDFGWSAASAAPQIAGKHNIAAAIVSALNMLSSFSAYCWVLGLGWPIGRDDIEGREGRQRLGLLAALAIGMMEMPISAA
jgi:hypothetical protein